jgi:ABC-type dipeptide/oligopeptide/nickel transport system permease subunit
MKGKMIKIISRLTFLSFLGLIVSLGVVINKTIMMDDVSSIPYQMPLPFFVLTFLGLLILALDEDKKRLVNNR